MDSELPFIGFHELIQDQLAASDQRSFSLIKRCLIEDQTSPAQPFTVLIQKLTGKVLTNGEAIVCWKQILKHKIVVQQKLGRTVGIQTAAIDYFEYHSPVEMLFRLSSRQHEPTVIQGGEAADFIYRQGYHLEKLKEELLRAKRYKHALSVIMVDLDNFHVINESLGYKNGDKVLTTIVRIIKKTIRSVDFFCRLSGDRFFLILPNTNQREARELAERIRVQINERTGRLSMLSEGVTATLSVGQCSHTDSSIEFIRRIERVLDEGRHRDGNAVFSIC
ncbi:MAG: GGDEF domain-containing protein [Chitinispirillaceae bacterium]|nr:GGDEF domain-containing protein [Chitinispirillaceae bacterium]